MNIGAIINILLLIGAIQGFIFIGVTFFLRKRIEKPVLFLNLFVLFLSLNNLQSWLLESKISEDSMTTFFTAPWYIFIVPMFYSFLVHYLEISQRKNPLVLISMALFIVAVVVRSWLIAEVQHGVLEISILESYNLVEDSFALAYSIILYFLSVDIVKRQQKLYPEILVYDNLLWVRKFLRLGGVVFVLWAIAVLLNIFSENIKAPESYYPLRLVSSILIYWVGYQAFFRYSLLKDRIKLRKIISKNRQQKQHALKEESIHNEPRTKLTFEQFENHIVDTQAFLNPSLGLDIVADELDVGVSTLSKLVNDTGKNFSDYINSARVKEAQRLLIHPDFENYTIVAIGLECGFNSKSTFYNAFKKNIGVTPTQFRKSAVRFIT